MRPPVPVLLMTNDLGIGGSERQLAEIAMALEPSRFQAHVGCLRANGMRAAELRAAGIPILELPVRSFRSFSAIKGARMLLRYIREHRIELVHTFDVPQNVFAAPVAWMARRPVVLTSQRAHRLLTPGLFHRLLRVTDRLADGIVVNCEYMRRHLVEDENVPFRQVHLCYNGIDTSLFRPDAVPAFHPHLGPASIVIGTVCGLRREKGLDTLVAAFASVAREHPNTMLLIVGSGRELESLQDQAKVLGVIEQCVFVPETNQVAPWLRAMNIFVLPSLSEAFSNSLMEAMACGRCVVASNVGGNPELADGARRGLLFQPGNAADLAAVLRGLIVDPTRRASLGKAAQEFLTAGFSIAMSAARMSQIYDSFLSAREKEQVAHQR